ncbi:S8 family serine peptidase [Pelomonas sp. SE-A7]|uniref:S8 family serine peptidase n=1 Tax=Pelomonas sp. SE-A7 TaxID=3054953 RepID=UPI00259C8F3F|nr:S8 family serine peptidase [Pelomonas sp. SE-A7]MDM4767013.1 S8 family serine peptidase [Pelomonas sp. SE-A7]
MIKNNKRPSALTLLSLAALALMAGAACADDDTRRPYVVQLADAPAASYAGGVAGLAATKPASGSRLNLSASAVQDYIRYVEARQDQVLGNVGTVEPLYRYSLVFNGFAAMLTDAEARSLKSNPAVAAVEVDVPRALDTNYTPTMLGLNAPGGLWSQLGGTAGAGENVVIGVIDGGVWPENPSFADRVDEQGRATHDPAARVAYDAPPASWKGACEAGQAFDPARHCNNKLIGARVFNKTFLQEIAKASQSVHTAEFLSPRDNGGHGTHTASTAGGNANVVGVIGNGQAPVNGISGMAPRARVAVYKVCWTRYNAATTSPDPRWPGYQNGCYSSDSIMAIEQAIKDGVDVLNYSISGSSTNVADSVDVAFKAAVDAGVFVAASAGNAGPANTVAHLAPWMTTVGNSTHDRIFMGTVELGSGAKIDGASSNAFSASAPLVHAKDAGVAGLTAAEQGFLAQCFGDLDATNASLGWTKRSLLDPSKVAGKILVCDRGNNVLVNKSGNAKTAGATGMVLTNVAGFADTVINQAHVLSTVHMSTANGTALKAYMAANPGTARASLGNVRGERDPTLSAPAMADSSSRGPNQGNLNILKPDLTAPGSSILAAYTPDYTVAEHDAMIASGQAGRANWDLLSGTSMSSPHVAGLGALLIHKYPDWSPARVRSALMTTGRQVVNTLTGVQQGNLPWGRGAGFVQPNLAADPGLVYDLSSDDYNRFLCGVGQAGVVASVNLQPGINCATLGSIAATDLNLPSLTASNVLGTLTLNRKVTNVGNNTATYNATSSLPGFTVQVTPATLTLAPGESGSYQVKLTRSTAAQGAWQFGELLWSDGVHNVRSPLSARANLVATPALLRSTAAAGSKQFPLGTGFDGAITVVKGMRPASISAGTATGVNTGASAAVGAACVAGNTESVKAYPVSIPAGTLVARFSLYGSETSGYAAGKYDDMDLVMVNSAGTVVGYAGVAGSDETIQLTAPAAGNYKVCVVAYQHATGANSTSYKLNAWVVQGNTSDATGNLNVLMPSRAYVGRTASASMSWSGLSANSRYLAAVGIVPPGQSAVAATTALLVETGSALPESAQVNGSRGSGEQSE